MDIPKEEYRHNGWWSFVAEVGADHRNRHQAPDSTLLPDQNSNEYSIVHEAGQASNRTVADLNVASYSRVHVIDTDPNSTLAALQDDDGHSFQLSEEEYAKRANTVLQWKKQNSLGRFDPNFNEHQRQLKEQNESLQKTSKLVLVAE
ncbi:hypothetical protein CJJ09_000026 [Candidozyma auris]|nr:hypothetical protein CJJ09_000026 [[Candida] auris]